MILKIMVGDYFYDETHQQIWYGDSTPPMAGTWTSFKKKTSRDTKYAMLELAGWQVEFHKANQNSHYSKWLVVRRAADKMGPAFSEAILRLRTFEVGGTLVLKLKAKTATATLNNGDLSVKFWNDYQIREVRDCPKFVNRIFADTSGQIRRVWRIYATSNLTYHFAPRATNPDAFWLENVDWALVMSVDNATGEDLRLVLYTKLTHKEADVAMQRFLRWYSAPSFFRLPARHALYDEATYKYEAK